MRVVRRDSVVDPKQLITSVGVALHRLWRTGEQLFVGELAEIPRTGLQFEIEFIQRNCSMVHDDLMERPPFGHAAVIAADIRNELIAPLFN